MTDEPEPRIIEAVGISANTLDPGSELGPAMEAAMSQAVLDCYAEGITDPDVMRARMLAAQEVVVAGWGAATDQA